jgi:hypothetical protein
MGSERITCGQPDAPTSGFDMVRDIVGAPVTWAVRHSHSQQVPFASFELFWL